jgi:kynurenine formamidase
VLSVKPFHTTSSPAKCNVSQLAMGTHQGTHLDAMFHFLDDGKTIDQMPLEWFHGPARMIRVPKAAGDIIDVADLAKHESVLLPGARILMNTGWFREFGSERFFSEFPSMTQDAARYLASRQLRLIGMDMPTPSKDYVEVHHILLAKEVEMVIVESLTNLDALPDDREFVFTGFPLNFAGRDGSPIRAVAQT